MRCDFALCWFNVYVFLQYNSVDFYFSFMRLGHYKLLLRMTSCIYSRK